MSYQATRIESDEEVQQALLKYRPVRPPGVAVHREPAPADDRPPVIRPTARIGRFTRRKRTPSS